MTIYSQFDQQTAITFNNHGNKAREIDTGTDVDEHMIQLPASRADVRMYSETSALNRKSQADIALTIHSEHLD